MKKHVFTAAVAVSSFLMVSFAPRTTDCIGAEYVTYAAIDKGQGQSTTELALMTAALNELDTISTLLENCNEANADAQAAKIEASIQRLKLYVDAGQKLEEENPNAMDGVDEEAYKEKIAAGMGRLMQAAMKVAMNECYGSEALAHVFESMSELDD